MQKIILDVDGVLANFTLGARKKMNEMFGVPIHDWPQQTTWHWDDITEDQENQFWEKVKDTKTWFWANLEPLVSKETFECINLLRLIHDVYFVTNRVGESAKMQTEDWLRHHGINTPTVIVTTQKGRVAKAIEATYALDDKWENVWDMANHCWSFMINRPCNESYNAYKWRVNTVEEFLNIATENRVGEEQKQLAGHVFTKQGISLQ